MNISYRQIICRIAEEDCSDDLCEKVMSRVIKMETRRLQTKAIFHGFVMIIVITAFIPIINNFINNIAHSEFIQYSSLLISDWSIITNNWKDIFLSILSSWPIMSSILLLGTIIVIANSLRRVIINTSTLREYKHLHI